jgi:hypothetical protein
VIVDLAQIENSFSRVVYGGKMDFPWRWAVVKRHTKAFYLGIIHRQKAKFQTLAGST